MGQIRKQLNANIIMVRHFISCFIIISVVLLGCNPNKNLYEKRFEVSDHIFNYNEIKTEDSTSCQLIIRIYSQESKRLLYLPYGTVINLVDENQQKLRLENSQYDVINEIKAGRYTIEIYNPKYKPLTISNHLFENGSLYIIDVKLHKGSGDVRLNINN